VPANEIVILGHSMGGLVARSACHVARAAGRRWLEKLRALVFLGTPHHGAPLERGGHWIDTLLGVSPYSAAFTRLGRARSAGITDLRHGSVLESDWHGKDRFAHGVDTRTPAPLPPAVACYAIAASLSKRASAAGTRPRGDGLVPVASALGEHKDPRFALPLTPTQRWVAYDTGHLQLLGSLAVCEQVRRWLAE
jgi:pimeloyl-ACP methyl ester carboxylesterase